MDRIRLRIAVALLALGVPALASAQGRSFTDRTVPGMQQADRHNPFSRNYTDMTPGGYARRHSHGHYRGGRSYSFGYPSIYGYHGHDHFSHGYYDYGPTYYDAPWGPWGLGGGFGYPQPAYPPLVIPPETLFGLGALPNPGAGAQFGAAPPANNIIVPPPKEKDAPQPRRANAETLARAEWFVTAGDKHFAAQRYRDANRCYRTATEAAPSLVEAYFRQGQALVAMSSYDAAATAFQRGLRLGPDWTDADFSVTELYGDNGLAKTSHLEALAAATDDEPAKGELLLLVGLQLYFDAQSDRAKPFLEKAATLLADPALNLDAAVKPAVADR